MNTLRTFIEKCSGINENIFSSLFTVETIVDKQCL